jgi:hypothetical protein
MRLEVELIEGGGNVPAPDLPRVPITRRRRRIDRFDTGVLLLFGLVSLVVLALDLWQVVVRGRVWTGTDGLYIVDQLQYLAWIRDASHHVLVSNLFVARPTPADYFQPTVAISGALSALGLSPSLSLLLWKPVAVGAFFFAVRAYVRRSVIGRWPRRAALVLALFFGSFTIVYGRVSVLGDLFPGFLSWGYVFGLMALAAMVWALLAYAGARSSGRRVWLAGVLGGLASLLHPWNGELLAALIVAAEILLLAGERRRAFAERLQLPAVTLGGIAIPLLYYAILGKTDVSWTLAQQASKHSFSFWSITLAIAPLLLPALLAYRRRPTTFLAAATRAWPVAAFGIFVLSGTSLGATPLHAFQGITIPLSVLAVQGLQSAGWRRLPRPLLVGSVVVALFTIPATAYEIKLARYMAQPTPDNANFITRDERSAIDYLARDPEPGSVLTRDYLGALVPSQTSRHVYVGDCLWDGPQCLNMMDNAQSLFDGSLDAAAARSLVLTSGSRFVLADCQTTADIRTLLGPLIQSERSFGCAAVYEVA